MNLAKWDLTQWFRPKAELRTALTLLEQLVNQARNAEFYTQARVPDTLDGRFDMIVAHLVLVMHRMKGERLSGLSQALFDGFFSNMDDSLREMGVGDMSIPKKIKAMSEAVFGRIEAYDKGLEAKDAALLGEAAARNIYRLEAGAPVTPEAEALGAYLAEAAKTLAQMDDKTIEAGQLRFPEPRFS